MPTFMTFIYGVGDVDFMKWFMICPFGVSKSCCYSTSGTNNRNFSFSGAVPPHAKEKGLWYQFRNTFLDLVVQGKLVTWHYFHWKNQSSLYWEVRPQRPCGFLAFALLRQEGPVGHWAGTWLRIMCFRLCHNCMEIPGKQCVGLGEIRTDNAQWLLIFQFVGMPSGPSLDISSSSFIS